VDGFAWNLTNGELINSAKFYFNQARGFDSVGSNFWPFHRIDVLPLTQGLNYCSLSLWFYTHTQQWYGRQ